MKLKHFCKANNVKSKLWLERSLPGAGRSCVGQPRSLAVGTPHRGGTGDVTVFIGQTSARIQLPIFAGYLFSRDFVNTLTRSNARGKQSEASHGAKHCSRRGKGPQLSACAHSPGGDPGVGLTACDNVCFLLLFLPAWIHPYFQQQT